MKKTFMFDFFFHYIWIKMITDIEKLENKILEIKLTLWQQKITEFYFHFVLVLMASNINAMIV